MGIFYILWQRGKSKVADLVADPAAADAKY